MNEAIFTGIVICAMSILLVLEIFRPSLILASSLIILHIGKIITLKETFDGFSNHGLLTLIFLYVIAGAMQSSSSFNKMVYFFLGKNKTSLIYGKLMVMVSFLSSFLNNTPIVASFIPIIKRWADKNHFSSSKLLIPLSYAAIMGGMCTLIGSSTNLIIHGLLLADGYDGFTFFQIGTIGMPVAIIVIIYFTTIGHYTIPKRKEIIEDFTETAREFMVEVKIEKSYPYIGKTVVEANLRQMKGLFLFQIIRNDTVISPVRPDEIILKNDRLFFNGRPDTIYDLVKTPGFHILKDAEFDLNKIDNENFKSYEAVISNSSPLRGVSIKDSGFRSKYNAVILAIHRNGHRLNKKIGDIVLQANDTIFILAKKDFDDKWYNSSDFSLVSSSIEEPIKPRLKGNLALLILFLMILSVVTGVFPSLLIAAFIASGLMIAFKIINFHDAKSAINIETILMIASALGIGKAIANSGLAESFANLLINNLERFGTIGILAGLFLMTNFYTEFITNNASAAMIYPIAVNLSNRIDIPIMALILTVTIAASASFATPIGYQTNTMVYSAGGYKFRDFAKTGIPVTLITGIMTILLVYFKYIK